MEDSPSKILVLDDETELRGMLQRYLGDQGFVVRAVSDAAQMDRLLQREPFDVLVLDLMMPGEDGLSICRRLRVMGETIPILMLTARGDPVDRILGLEMGADDYLAKPFDPRELVARLHAMIRRQRMLHTGRRPEGQETVAFGDYVLNIETRQLHKGELEVPLSSSEFLLLKVLAANPNRPLGRESLLERVRGRDYGVTDRSIDALVLRLRRQIEDDPAKPRHVQTVWGFGYVFVPNPAAPVAADGGDGA